MSRCRFKGLHHEICRNLEFGEKSLIAKEDESGAGLQNMDFRASSSPGRWGEDATSITKYPPPSHPWPGLMHDFGSARSDKDFRGLKRNRRKKKKHKHTHIHPPSREIGHGVHCHPTTPRLGGGALAANTCSLRVVNSKCHVLQNRSK